MSFQSCCVIGALFLTSGLAQGQAAVYEPLGTWVDPQAAAMAQWKVRLSRASERPESGVISSTRPNLAGLRPRSVELLEDAILRKMPKLRDQAQARGHILKQYRSGERFLRGYMAEAIFVDRNPGWHYVKNPNASQHDVYRWRDGQRPPYAGQVKYHDSGDPSQYVRDMKVDYRSPRFFIPDDHVEATKELLRSRAKQAEVRGAVAEAKRLWRDYARLRPIRATSMEIRSDTTGAARSVAREKLAVYVSFGAVSALAVAPIVFDLATGRMSAGVAMYHIARSLSLYGVGYGTDQLLARIKDGALRRGLRGSVIVASAVTVAEVGWLLHQYGWRRAFYQPEFYEGVGGTISATGLALSAGQIAGGLAWMTGPLAPWIVIVSSAAGGTIGYFGGSVAGRLLFDTLFPERIHEGETRKINEAREAIAGCIRRLSDTQSSINPATGNSSSVGCPL